MIRAVTGAGWQVSVFTRANEFGDIRAHVVNSANELSQHEKFRCADVIIYHFGYFDELFEIVRRGNGRAVQISVFHNVTPSEFIAEEFRPVVLRSFEQIQRFHHADRLWPLTQTNARVLIQAGLDADRTEIINPVVQWPRRCLQSTKQRLPVEILFVGRMTKSKGVLDLLEAIRRIGSPHHPAFRVSLIGKPNERSYVDRVQDQAAALEPLVEYVGQCGDDELERRYHAAHILAIPSYHEGFCRPVAEGLRAGCIPVGYASYHLPIVANGLGLLVARGNVGALAAALQSMIESVVEAGGNPTGKFLPLDRGPTGVAEFDRLAGEHVAQFSFDRFAGTVINAIRNLLPQTSNRITAE
jgi:glycosyltransferase involved in cell wall biosynthesis